MPKRCALGCVFNSKITRHQFPHRMKNPERFKAWVHIVGGKLESEADYDYYSKKVICDVHFTKKDKNRNNRLNYLAVPSLQLHGVLENISAPVTEAHTITGVLENISAPVTEPHTITGIFDQPEISKAKSPVSPVKSDFEEISKNEEVAEKPGVPRTVNTCIASEPLSDRPSTSKSAMSMTEKPGIPPTTAKTYIASGPLINRPSTSKSVMLTTGKSGVRGGSVVGSSSVKTSAALDPSNTPSTSKSTISMTEYVAERMTLEHSYCKQKKPTKSTKCNRRQKLAPSLLLSQLRTSRRRIKLLQTEIVRLRKRNESFQLRLANAEKLSMNSLFKKITKNMTPAAKIFTKMQFSQTGKKTPGRRFTIEEKVLSLSIYKKSPKTYSLLSKYFTLPSAKTLKRLLAEIKLETGLNKSIFLKMKETVKNLSAEDRLCTLIFDEMSLSPQIHYDCARDRLRGFTFDGKKIADHALVFMIKGIKKKYKQPVAYYFTNALNKIQLKDFLLKVIKYVERTGLKILCTVCDQSTTNVSVINELIDEAKSQSIKEGQTWDKDIMVIGKSKIIPLFDVPHLLKGVRNNLLTKDLKYFDDEEKCEKTIKWTYFQKVYEADKCYGELKLLHKLTDEHIYADKIKKMRVKGAAQIFSHSVAVATEHLSARGDVPAECRNLIKFTKLIDNVFDSLNAGTFDIPNGKLYKGCVRRHSPHHDLWTNAIRVLESVTFIKTVKGKNNKIRVVESKAIPSIKNFIRTIKGVQNLWILLSQMYSFDAILTRNLNQDPLENFFGNIRSYGARNTAPNTVAFEGAFKSLLLNNYNSPHSLNANCEEDKNSCLQTLDFFVKDSATPYVPTPDEASQFSCEGTDEIVVPFIYLTSDSHDAGQGNYVCGWALGKCLKHVSKTCKQCKEDFNGDSKEKSNQYIKAREYKKGGSSLLYPAKSLEKCFINIQSLVEGIIKRDVPKNNIKKNIKTFTSIFVEFPFKCDLHKTTLKEYFENIIINVMIYSWCRSVNRILSGKMCYTGEDETKIAAQVYRNKHKH